ncbi:hypothetical protein OF820_01255 [Oceanotoga sp. DSM 15011]|jgi:hypothetical protein|uniref:Uncharacterized protein n=1 Tax=Oceanotoga teriensis TaxID=515440 RepID=A0AA45C962_9BACT|nr:MULTISPECIES: hypothetical protein [Oceanotoga]MDN5341570.1 hypothetical protein [Oceanotoga sp.]MDO7977818.1 hypothetical protein [Oceanotoga teriensis]PWJ96502.1 hypothetical protein C7380_10174 [Oceanotoga teriensis]UYP00323.1 hypothetical protein OF820_01255 [Oceanotoga sp. DSM 15011]
MKDKFHKLFLDSALNDGFIHKDHIHPVIVVWASLNENTKEDFIKYVNDFDKEYAVELKEYIEDLNYIEDIIPIYFPFEVESEEQLEAFNNFLEKIKDVIDIKSYSILSEVNITDDDDIEEVDDEDLVYYPSIFTENDSGECYMTVVNYENLEVVDEYSGEFEKNDPYIQGLRFPIL